LKKIIKFCKTNLKIIENYFFTTTLQVLNSFFYLLIYPYVLNVLGPSNYGLYLFANSISMYFLSFVQFGFDIPALKKISLDPTDKFVHSHTIFSVLYSKSLLFFISIFIFFLLFSCFDIVDNNMPVFSLCFLQVVGHVMLPTWYFQGIQKMKLVTYIQFFLKILSLPVFFLFVQHSSDLIYFVLIIVLTSIIGGIVSMYILFKYESIYPVPISISEIINNTKSSFPFFISNSLNTIKQQTANIIIGSNFSMNDVAVYDLAMKVFTVPTLLVSSINNVLFPRLISSNLKLKLKIISIENFIGVGIVVFLLLTGKYIIQFLGGEEMKEAYLVLVILSFSVFTILSVGAIFYFILIPLNFYNHIAVNQFLALVVFLSTCLLGLVFYDHMLVVPIAFAISSIIELIYSYILVFKIKNDK